jgi:mono/diheme cytochrome c family protein
VKPALVLAALWLLAVALAAGCGPARRGEPFGPPLTLTGKQERGKALYMKHCNGCHPLGGGGLGPSLADKPLPTLVIKTQVRRGYGPMPAFDEAALTDEELDAVTAYVNRLQE